MKPNHFIFSIIGICTITLVLQLSGMDLRSEGALFPPASESYHIWQYITHMFLHDNIVHLMMNMYAVYFFGMPVLSAMSVKKFTALYFLGGLVGALVYQVTLYFQLEQQFAAITQSAGLNISELNDRLIYASRRMFHSMQPPMLGASGAAFAVLAAFAVRFPNAPLSIMFLPFEFRAQYFVLTLVIYEIFAQISGISLFGSNIAHMAHVGGAVMGALLAWLWRKRHIKWVK